MSSRLRSPSCRPRSLSMTADAELAHADSARPPSSRRRDRPDRECRFRSSRIGEGLSTSPPRAKLRLLIPPRHVDRDRAPECPGRRSRRASVERGAELRPRRASRIACGEVGAGAGCRARHVVEAEAAAAGIAVVQLLRARPSPNAAIARGRGIEPGRDHEMPLEEGVAVAVQRHAVAAVGRTLHPSARAAPRSTDAERRDRRSRAPSASASSAKLLPVRPVRRPAANSAAAARYASTDPSAASRRRTAPCAGARAGQQTRSRAGVPPPPDACAQPFEEGGALGPARRPKASVTLAAAPAAPR